MAEKIRRMNRIVMGLFGGGMALCVGMLGYLIVDGTGPEVESSASMISREYSGQHGVALQGGNRGRQRHDLATGQATPGIVPGDLHKGPVQRQTPQREAEMKPPLSRHVLPGLPPGIPERQ